MGSAAMAPATDSTIAGCLQAIPEVEGVYVFHIGGGEALRVMTVVNEEEDGVYERIYRKELEVSKSFPSIQFDFNVVARRGRAMDLIMGKNLPVWIRPASECPQLNSI